MRIFFLVHDDYAAGGIQRSTLAARECLVESGHDVTVLCIKTKPNGHAERFSFFRPVTRQNRRRLSFWLFFLRDLRRLLRDETADLVVGMGLSSAVIARLATIGLSGIRCIGSERSYPPATPVGTVWEILRRLTFPLLDAIVSQTTRTANWYGTAMGIQADRLVVITNVVIPPLAALPPLLPAVAALQEQPVIACVGRFHSEKGFDFALEVFARVRQVCPHARLLMIGEGPMKGELAEQAAKLGIAESIMFHPPIDDLAQIWPAVDVFLLTSRYEGFPNVLAEAMAYGIAPISFDCPTGPAEMIVDGQNGFIVQFGDCAAAARRCVQLLGDESLRRRLGKQASTLSSRFSSKRIGAQWNDLVDRVGLDHTVNS